APAAVRSVKSNAFVVNFDAEKGEVATAGFTGDVEFSEPGRKAWAQKAALDEEKGTLVMTGDPRLVEESRESDLRADTIEIGTQTHELSARENVRHTVPIRSVPGGQSSSGPSLFLSRFLDYDSATRTARYRENALLRSGKDELRAPLIVVEEPAQGHRRLTASGALRRSCTRVPTLERRSPRCRSRPARPRSSGRRRSRRPATRATCS